MLGAASALSTLPVAVDAFDVAVSLSDSSEKPCTIDMSKSELVTTGCSCAEPRPADHGTKLACAEEEATDTTETKAARAVGGLARREGVVKAGLVAAGLG